jgi:hypothetical protein
LRLLLSNFRGEDYRAPSSATSTSARNVAPRAAAAAPVSNDRDVTNFRTQPGAAVHLAFNTIGAYAALLPRVHGDTSITGALVSPTSDNAVDVVNALQPGDAAHTAARIAACTAVLTALPHP